MENKESNSAIREWAIFIMIGAVAGFINGMWGGGGGIFVVPSLVFLLHFTQKKSQATALLIILPLCVISTIVYVLQGIYDLKVSLYVGIGVLAGGILGAVLLKKISNKVLSYIFYLIMIAAGIKLIIG